MFESCHSHWLVVMICDEFFYFHCNMQRLHNRPLSILIKIPCASPVWLQAFFSSLVFPYLLLPTRNYGISPFSLEIVARSGSFCIHTTSIQSLTFCSITAAKCFTESKVAIIACQSHFLYFLSFFCKSAIPMPPTDSLMNGMQKSREKSGGSHMFSLPSTSLHHLIPAAVLRK